MAWQKPSGSSLKGQAPAQRPPQVPLGGSREDFWDRSRQRRQAFALQFHARGSTPWTAANIRSLKDDIERLAPENQSPDRAVAFRSLDNHASVQQRFFIYMTLWERLRHQGKPRGNKRGPGRPRKGAEPIPRAAIFRLSPETGRLVHERDRRPDLWKGRLFSDLHAFLKPIYGAERSYERVAALFEAVFGTVIEPESVKRELLRNKRS